MKKTTLGQLVNVVSEQQRFDDVIKTTLKQSASKCVIHFRLWQYRITEIEKDAHSVPIISHAYVLWTIVYTEPSTQ